jgi:hypothetical protein
MIATHQAYKPTRQQQQAFIAKYFPHILPSQAASKLIAKGNPNFTEAELFRFLAAEGLDREFAIYCWLKSCKNKYDKLRAEPKSDRFSDRFTDPEPSSFAPQTTSLDNWLNATIQQQLVDIDAAKSRRWDARHWLAILLAIEMFIGAGILVRENWQDNFNQKTSKYNA